MAASGSPGLEDIASFAPRLPNELVLTIFSQVDIPTMLNAAQVCQQWSTVVNDPMLWEGVTANLSIDQDMNSIAYVIKERGIKRICVSGMSEQTSSQLRNLTRNLSHWLVYLDLSNIRLSSSQLCKVFMSTMSCLLYTSPSPRDS